MNTNQIESDRDLSATRISTATQYSSKKIKSLSVDDKENEAFRFQKRIVISFVVSQSEEKSHNGSVSQTRTILTTEIV